MTVTNVALFNDTAASRHFGCDAVSATIEQCVAAAGGRLVHRQPVGRPWDQCPQALEAIAAADVVIVNGEGSIHHGSERTRMLARLAPHCAERGIPCYLFNATLQANDASTMEALAQFTAIWVRESRSRDELAAAGIAATVCPDLSLFQALPEPSAERTGPVFIDSVVKRETRLLEREAIRHGTVLLSMKRDEEGEYFPARHWLTRLVSRYPRRRVPLPGVADFRAFARYIGQYPALVTGRFHGFCFAVNQGIPVAVCRSNTWKCEAMLRDIGLADERLWERGRRVLPQPYSTHEQHALSAYRDEARRMIPAVFAEMLGTDDATTARGPV